MVTVTRHRQLDYRHAHLGTHILLHGTAEQHDGESPRGMNMLKNKGARNLGLACIHHTGYTDGPDVLVQCDYDVGGHDWD